MMISKVISIIVAIVMITTRAPASRAGLRAPEDGTSRVFITGGCSGRGVQRIGVVLYNELVYDSIQITTPRFHCTLL